MEAMWTRYDGTWGRALSHIAILFAIAIIAGCGSDEVAENAGSDDGYTVGGSASGVEAQGLILQLNGAHDLIVDEDGSFVFDTELAAGDSYEVTVLEAPQDHLCHVANASGVIGDSDIANVQVLCERSDAPEQFFDIFVDLEQSQLETVAGENVSLQVEVTNTGTASGTQDIVLEVEGQVVDIVEDLSLDGTDEMADAHSESLVLEWETGEEDGGDYALEVKSDDDAQSLQASVEPIVGPSFFEVVINVDDSRLEVGEGESLAVVVDVTNTGGQPASQNIDLELDDEVQDTRFGISLESGDSRQLTYYWDTDVGAAGDYLFEVRSQDDSDSVEASVLEAGFLEVTIDEQNSELIVEEGDTIVVQAAIENTGEWVATQDIGLDIDGGFADQQVGVEVGAGQVELVTLEWSTGGGDAGSYTATVISNDDSDSSALSVLSPAFLDVSIDEEASALTVEAGQPVTVVADVENTGDVADTQNIVLQIDGGFSGVVSDLEVDGGEVETVTLEWETEAGDAGAFIAEMIGQDSSDSAEGEVLMPAFLALAIDTAESSLDVEEGQPVIVEVAVTNTGQVDAEQDIELHIDETTVDVAPGVAVAAGETESITLQWQTGPGDGGDFSAVVSSDDDSVEAAVSVQTPSDAEFTVTIDATASTLDVEVTQTVVVVADIANAGGEPGTQDIELFIDGEPVAVESDVELVDGSSTQVILEWETGPGDVGEYSAEVTSDDDQDDVTVTVDAATQSALFSVDIDESQSLLEVEEQEVVTVVATIENSGDLTGSQTITLHVDGGEVDASDDIELDGGESTQVTLEWLTDTGDEGSYELSVLSDDDTDTVMAEVSAPALEPALFEVSIDETQSTLAVDEGQTVVVVAHVENTGEASDTQDVILEVNGFFEDLAPDLQLDGGSDETVTLAWDTDVGDAGTQLLEVSSADDSDAIEATVSVPTASLSGTVVDTLGEESMAGVDVLLLEAGTDTVVAQAVVDTNEGYEITDVEAGDYDMRIQAPGLEPNYALEQAGGDSRLSTTLSGGANVEDLSVDWIRNTDLMIDGGRFDLEADDLQSELAFELPGCEFNSNTQSWEPVDPNGGGDGVEISYSPSDECFRIEDVGIDLLTGELALDSADIHFSDVQLFIEDPVDFVNSATVDFEWLLDDAQGAVDFTDGSLLVAIDLRILVGGVVNVFLAGDEYFGAHPQAQEYDCQLTKAWGGGIESPQLDTDDEQIGDYLHDPIEMRLVTADSGPHGIAGEPYDRELAFFVTVDNDLTIDRLAQGEYAAQDDGIASCGQMSPLGVDTDFAETINDLANLPAESGDVLSEFDFVIPQE